MAETKYPSISVAKIKEFVEETEIPILIIVFGTPWSQTCRFTYEAIQKAIQETNQAESFQLFFTNEDTEIEFCLVENIQIGFPAVIVFVSGERINFYIEPIMKGNPPEKKGRYARQINLKLAKIIVQQCIRIRDEEIRMINLTE